MPDTASPSPGVHYLCIEPDRAGQRLDNFLFGQLKGVPKSRIYRIIRDGQVRVNRRRVRQTYRLQAGDQVRIPPVRVSTPQSQPAPGEGLASRLAEALLYRDERLLVYDKPAGLAVHGGSGISRGLIETLRALHPQEQALELVHRLDRDTSGCIMVTRHRGFLRRLQRLMQAGGVEKRYWMLCHGNPDGEQVIEAPLRKDSRGGERIVRVARDGKQARTRFRLLERLGSFSLVEGILDTGRTHQIRVHAAWAGFPLLGDAKYGPESGAAPGLPDRRLYLHARSLRFRHPDSGEQLALEAPLDEVFAEALKAGRESIDG